MAYVIADDREHDVNPLLEDMDVAVYKRRLDVGDFRIMNDEKIEIMVERKTWADLASSITDGRADAQVKAMKEQRDAHKCRLLLVVEGMPAFPTDDQSVTHYGEMKYSALYTKLRHLLINHDIPFWRTCNCMDTAKLLRNFVMDFGAANGNTSSESYKKLKIGGVRKKSDEEILRGIWSNLNKVSPMNAHIYATKMTIAHLITKATVEELANINYDSGSRVGNKKAKDVLDSVAANDTRVLSGVPGIGDKKARTLLSKVTLKELAAMQENDLVDFCKGLKVDIGPKRSQAIYKYFNMLMVLDAGPTQPASPTPPLPEVLLAPKKQQSAVFLHNLFMRDKKTIEYLVNMLDAMNWPGEEASKQQL